MVAKILLRSLSVLMFLIFAASLFGMILAIKNGTAVKVMLFFQLFLNPSLAIENWLGAINIASVALMQFLFIGLFFFLGKSAWAKSNAINTSKIESLK
jgi:hypothetical protein